ncbi:hypothetical protein AGMMS49975_14390 [Clostridia bacterium]|nr:hypothetical protein AGMMS49975_14390 [Clostridia bacterium]
MVYTHTGNGTQNNVTLIDKLPAGLEYIVGSTRIKNTLHPNDDLLSSFAPQADTPTNNVTTNDINIGSYTGSSNAAVTFSARVLNAYLFADYDQDFLMNTAKIISSQGEIPSSWAESQVNAAIAAGLVPASLQARYTQPATRAEFAALSVAMYETRTGMEITGRKTFADTSDVNVEKMALMGVVSGVGNNMFAPDNQITREQAAVMLVRLAETMREPLEGQTVDFADNSDISSWAVESIGKIQSAGIMSGIGDNKFAPQTLYTIEQSIVTIMRLFDWIQPKTAGSVTVIAKDSTADSQPSAASKSNRRLTADELKAWVANYQSGGGPNESELEVLRIVNDARVAAGLQPLKLSQNLMMAARFKAQEMSDLDYFEHNSPVYGDFGNIGKELFGVYTGLENIATEQMSAEEVIAGWLSSPGHRDNIMSPYVSAMGVGFYNGRWAQQFGRYSPMTISEQQGALKSGVSGTVTYTVTTKDLADGFYWINVDLFGFNESVQPLTYKIDILNGKVVKTDRLISAATRKEMAEQIGYGYDYIEIRNNKGTLTLAGDSSTVARNGRIYVRLSSSVLANPHQVFMLGAMEAGAYLAISE